MGISRAPGTRTTSIADALTPSLRSSERAPSSRRAHNASLKRLATRANRSPAPPRFAAAGPAVPTSASALRQVGVAEHFEPEAGHARHLARRGHQAHAPNAKIAQDLRANPVGA